MPADYGVDTFAPAVNSRGDVASIDAGGRVTNGFLPRSVYIAGRPSFLLNTVNQDLRYQAPHVPVMAFVRAQVLPRWGGDGAGNVTPLFVEQAFGRVTPIEGREFFIAGGKFDSVFGIEYLENPRSIEPGSRRRCSRATRPAPRWASRRSTASRSRRSGRRSASTSRPPTASNFVEALQPTDASLTGVRCCRGVSATS